MSDSRSQLEVIEQPFRARLFGPFALDGADGPAPTALGRKSRALLAYCLLAEQPVLRERLAALLWEDRGEDQARASLRQSLYELRGLASDGIPLIHADRMAVHIERALVASDLDRLRAERDGSDAAAVAALIGENPGDLLDGFDGIGEGFDDWLAAERTRRHEERRSIALTVARRAIEAGADGHTLAMRLFGADPLDEASAALAMEASVRAGDRDGVRRVYARHADCLRRDLDLDPSPEQTALRDRLLAMPSPAPARIPATPVKSSDSPLSSTDQAVIFRPEAPSTLPRIPRRAVLGGALAAGAAAVGIGGWQFWRWQHAMPRDARDAMEVGLSALRLETPDQITLAITNFQRAVNLAPGFAEPWAQLAVAYAESAERYAPPAQAQLHADRSREAAARALAIDPGNSEAPAALADLSMEGQDWLSSKRALDKGFAAAPDGFSINRVAVRFYSDVGYLRRVQEVSQRALAIDPLWPKVYTDMVMSSWSLGNFAEADRWMEQAWQQWPRHYGLWFVRERLLSYSGRAAEALAMIEDVPNRPVGIPDWNFEGSRLEAQALLTRSGKDIDAAVRSMEDEVRKGAGFTANAIEFFSEVGLVDKAIALTEAVLLGEGIKLNQTRYSTEQGQYFLHRNRETWFLWPSTANLRGDARLAPILEKIGLVDFWRRAGQGPDLAIRGV